MVSDGRDRGRLSDWRSQVKALVWFFLVRLVWLGEEYRSCLW